MKRKTMMPERPGHGTYRRFALLAMMIFVVGSMSASIAACATETGIKGMVLWGPTKPGPTSVGQNDEAPLRASFTVVDADNKAVEFESDSSGHFEVALPPGEYTIVPDKKTPIPMAEKQTTQVTVPKDGFAVVTIRLETGMK